MGEVVAPRFVLRRSSVVGRFTPTSRALFSLIAIFSALLSFVPPSLDLERETIDSAMTTPSGIDATLTRLEDDGVGNDDVSDGDDGDAGDDGPTVEMTVSLGVDLDDDHPLVPLLRTNEGDDNNDDCDVQDVEEGEEGAKSPFDIVGATMSRGIGTGVKKGKGTKKKVLIEEM